MADKKKTKVTKAKPTDIVVAKDYREFEGRGFQNQTHEDIAVPFLNVLQSNSPEVEKGEGQIKGAEAGMFINTVTKDMFEKVQLVPAVTRHRFIEWVPRKQGGGLVGFHEVNSDVVKEAKARAKAEGAKYGKYSTEDGNDLVETFEIFGVQSIDGQPGGMALVPFTSKKIKSYKHIMGRLQSYQVLTEDGRRQTPPLFAHLIEISTEYEKNAEGTFYKTTTMPAVENDVEASTLETNDPRFLMAAELEKLVAAGTADADYSKQKQEGVNAEDVDDEPPF